MLGVCINAIHGGADELEVCSSLTEGGLTPSAGLVKLIRDIVNNIPKKIPIRKTCDNCSCGNLKTAPKVNVMIRSRTGSDFCYSKEEMDTMLSDIDVFKVIGVDRFVFGALTNTQDIDEINCTEVIRRAHPIPVTFHRAFDVCRDPQKTILSIIDIGFSRLLTSGQEVSADNANAIQLIKKLYMDYGDKIEIMPGAGINLLNAKGFIDMGCKIVHSSCKRIRYLPQIEHNLRMGTSDSEHIYVTDEIIVKKMKEI
ncbi:unnamed protein product [Arctia plantaginis]|uniref:Copper homeostasis protein cutC homolog n=1 Tax=Arctia plantaginis TaxID=874455 RepID=A0A8S0ZWJ2_ARCPL|nr:unnamed protein product [Arctia plantaginis]